MEVAVLSVLAAATATVVGELIKSMLRKRVRAAARYGAGTSAETQAARATG